MNDPFLNRAELLLGTDAIGRLGDARVILFGVGGVGSWCAEGLVRSGIGHLTIVDADNVSVSNINRQLMATSSTVGKPKVEVLRQRLTDINPRAEIVALQRVYDKDTAASFGVETYDYVVDAIDSLSNKMELILQATRKVDGGRMPVLFSAMGAALKRDPSQIRVSPFWEVDGCPLAAALRRRMRRQHRFPERKFRCVWSPEVLPNKGIAPATEEGSFLKAQTNGSLVQITAIMGFTLASLVVNDIVGR